MADLKTLLGEPVNKPASTVDIKSLLGEPVNKQEVTPPGKPTELPVDEQATKEYFGETITPKTPIQSVSEDMAKNQGVLENKYAEYVTKKTAEITGGLNIPNPLTSPDPETFKAEMDNYQRVLRENPMAERDNEKITAIGQLIQKAKETDEVVSRYEEAKKTDGIISGIEETAGKLGEGIKKGIEDYGRGYFDLAKNIDTNSAVKELSSKLEKLDKGENVPLDEGDKLLMQALGQNADKAKQLEALDPMAFNIGRGAGTSIGFTGEFLLTGGLGAGIAKGITAGVTKAIAEGATVSAAKRIGVGLSAKLAQTGVQVLGMPTFYKGIAEDVSRGEGFGESLFKNYYNTFSENFTERIFLKNPWNQSTIGAVDNFIGRLGVNMHTDKGLVGILASTGEEVLEEKIGEVMQAPLNYKNFKDFWKDYWDVKKNAELIGSVALMVAPMGIVSYSAKKWDDVQLNKTGKLLTGGIRSELDEVLNDQKLSLKEQYDLVGRIVESHATDQTLGDNPAEMAGNIIRYVQGKTKASVSSGIEDRAKSPTIGEMEEITPEDQAKVDYLQGQGVKIPDGTSITQLNELYETEKAKNVPETVETIGEAKPIEIKPAEPTSVAAEEIIPKEVPIAPTEIKESLKQQKAVVVRELRMNQIEEDLIHERQKPQTDETKIKSLQDEFNALEKEAEKQEWESVFNAPIETIKETIDGLIKKEKEKPDGFGSFIDKKDARESKAVVDRYSDPSKLSNSDVTKDFTDALTGNPTTWYADGLKLRESVLEANRRGVETDSLIKKAVDLYVKDGFSEKEAKSVVSSMIEPILKGSTVEKVPIAELQQKQPIAGEQQIEQSKTHPTAIQETEKKLQKEKQLSENTETDLQKNEPIIEEVPQKKGRKVLFKDNNGNNVVFDNGGYRIIVDDVNDAKYITLWHKETIKGKEYWTKRGSLDAYTARLVPKSRMGGKYLGVRSVEIEKAHRGKGYGSKLYKALIDFSGDQYNGIVSWMPNRINKKEVPSIYKKIGGDVKEEDFHIIDFKNEPSKTQKNEEQEEMRGQNGEEVAPETQKIKETAKKTADALRKAKFIQSISDLDKLSSDPTAILKVAWDGSVEAAAKTIELGGSIAQAVADGVKTLKESDWYKKLSDESKKIAEERFASDIETHLKTEGYATENGVGLEKTGEQAQELERGAEGRLHLRRNEGEGLEAAKGTEGEKKGGKVKRSRYGTRVAFGKKTPTPVKEKYKKEELYTYKEETHGEVDVVADKFLATATNDEALLSLHDKNIPVRVRTSIAYGLVARLNAESTPLFVAGNKAEYDPIMDKIVEVHKFVQDELATEAGRDVSYFGSNRVMQMLGGYQIAELARRGMQDSRNEQMKRKSFARTADHAQKEVEKEKKRVVEEVIDKIVKPKESKVSPEIEKIRKERSSLIDKWKKDRKTTAYSAVIPGLTQADIEFIPQLAASYIKEGFYQTKVLVKKIQRILDQEGIKVSDTDLETLFPKEYNGAPLEEHQKAEDLKKASLSLAKQIFGDVIDKKSPDSDPIVRMVKTLFSKFKETQLDRKVVEGMSDLEKLALAIREKDKYKTVWIEAKQAALTIVENSKTLSDEQKEGAKEKIEVAYKNATEFTFSQKLITDLIKEELSEKGMDIGEVVRDHYESKDVVKTDLIKSLIDKSGLDEKQAKVLADAVDKAFSTLMTRRIEGVLKKYIEKGTRKTSAKQKKGAEEIVHLASIGAFDNEKFRESFADIWGLANLDDSDIKYIVSQSDMITKIKSEAIRYDYKQQLLAHIANMQGMDWDALIDGFWYANVLSGLGTQLKNSLDAATAAIFESALYSGTSPFQLNRSRKALSRALKTRGLSNMRHTLRTGTHPFELGTDAPRQAKRVLESEEALVENKRLWAAIKMTAKYENTVFNIMMSSDALWGTVAYESILDAIITKEIYNEAKNRGIKLSKEQREAISQKIDEILKITPQGRAIIAEIVAQESEDFKIVQAGLGEKQVGFSKEQEMLRTYELMDEMRPKILVDEARRLAQIALGNIQPFGLLGYGMSHISNIVNTVGFKFYRPLAIKTGNKYHITFSGTESITLRPFSKIIPFTRIITSLATRALNWNPYVMGLRSATGQYGSMLWIGGKQTERFRKKLTPHEKKVLAKKAIILGVMYSALYGLTGGDEPEKGWIRITANGTGDWKGKNKQLEGAGWRAWNLQIGDYSFGYQYIYPLNGILGAFGYARDQQLYNGAGKDFGSFMKLLAEGSGVSLMQVLFSTPLSGLNTGLDILTEMYRGNVDTAWKFITKLTTNIGGGIVSPRILKDMEATYDILAKRADIQGVTFAEKMSDKIPFIGRNFAGKVEAIDIMGSSIKVKGPISAVFDFNTKSENSDLIRWLTEEVKYFRPIPTYEQEKFIVQEKGGNFNESRSLTGGNDTEEALWTEYNRKLGQIFKENVLLLKASGLSPEEINTELKSSWSNTVKEAKSYILELSMSHPLDKP